MRLDFKEEVDGVSDVFAFYALSGLTVGVPSGAVTTDGLMVSGDFFRGYGASCPLGRTLLPEDVTPQADPVAVITYRLWERGFGLDPRVVGQAITVNQHSFTVVGVLPRGYCGPQVGDSANVYVPMSAQSVLVPEHPLAARDHWWVNIMVRLEPKANEELPVCSWRGERYGNGKCACEPPWERGGRG